MKNRTIGYSIPRIEGLGKVTGQVKFPADFSLPGMLYGKTLRVPLASARVVRLDISKAEALAGVVKVVTAKDIPGENGHGVIFPDAPVLVADRVRSINDAVALVVAESEAIAEEALELITVEYD